MLPYRKRWSGCWPSIRISKFQGKFYIQFNILARNYQCVKHYKNSETDFVDSFSLNRPTFTCILCRSSLTHNNANIQQNKHVVDVLVVAVVVEIITSKTKTDYIWALVPYCHPFDSCPFRQQETLLNVMRLYYIVNYYFFYSIRVNCMNV